jgi:hypothetical protein
MGLANIPQKVADAKLKCDHAEVHQLVGKKMCMDLDSCQIDYDCDLLQKLEPLYFWTQDNPTKGLNQVNPFTKKPYKSVKEPNSIEAVIVYLPTRTDGIRHLYKYARYYDPTSTTTPDEYEMYNVTLDPLETKNLVNPKYSTPETQQTIKILQNILTQQRKKKMLTPNSPSQIIN